MTNKVVTYIYIVIKYDHHCANLTRTLTLSLSLTFTVTLTLCDDRLPLCQVGSHMAGDFP